MGMARNGAFLFVAALALRGGKATQAEAEAKLQQMMRLKSFMSGYGDWLWADYQTQCRAAAQEFQDAGCESLSEDACRVGECHGDPSITTESACTSGGHSWCSSCGGDAENSVCCADGNVECEFDENGADLPEGCCSMCIHDRSSFNNEGKEQWDVMCTQDGGYGPSVCGTEAGVCASCVNSSSNQGSQDDCESSGMCTGCGSNCPGDQGSCESSGLCTGCLDNCPQDEMGCNSRGVCTDCGGFCPDEESSCLASGVCTGCVDPCPDEESDCATSGTCSDSMYASESDCTGNGGSWTSATWTGATWTSATWTSATWTSATWLVSAEYTTREACQQFDKCGECTCAQGAQWCPTDQRSCEDGGVCSGCGDQCPVDPYSCNSSGMCSLGPAYGDELGCTGVGSCTGGSSDGSIGESSMCTAGGGTWEAGTWTRATWTPNTWAWLDDITDQDDCRHEDGRSWYEAYTWVDGEVLPTELVLLGDCSTGPEHTIDGCLRESCPCINMDRLLADADGGVTAADAVAANEEYYRNLSRVFTSNAVVTNHENAADRARITYLGDCLGVIEKPKNEGKLEMYGESTTHVLIMDPTNYASADQISVNGAGATTIIGGTSAGPILANTTGKIEIYDILNSGNLYVYRSQDIFVGGVVSSGNITMEGGAATLIDVENSGVVTAVGGIYKAYAIVNKGSVHVSGSVVDIHLICPSDGDLVLAEDVTGSVSYESGCGTVTVGAGVAVSVTGVTTTVPSTTAGNSPAAPSPAAAPSTGAERVAGTLRIDVADPAAFVNDPDTAAGVEKGLSTLLSVGEDLITVTLSIGEDARRLASLGRALSGSQVRADYTIDAPAGTTAADLATTIGSTDEADFTAAIQAGVDATVSTSYNVTVTEVSTSVVVQTPGSDFAPRGIFGSVFFLSAMSLLA